MHKKLLTIILSALMIFALSGSVAVASDRVPYVSQYDGSWDQWLNCAPACISMALKWYDGTEITPAQIRDELGFSRGMYFREIHKYLKDHGVRVKYALPTIEENLSDGIGIAVMRCDGYFHAIVLTGFDGTNFTYNDPMVGQCVMSETEFYSRLIICINVFPPPVVRPLI